MKKASHFDQFRKKKNSAVKESFKQQKREWRKEKNEFFEKQKGETGIRQTADSRQHPDARGRKPVTRSTGKRQTTNDQQHFTTRPQSTEEMPLNKFLAHAGVAARREAAQIIKKGLVKVNNKPVTEPGHKVTSRDTIVVNGKQVHLSKNLVYILLNKPKDYITTAKDPEGRKTIFELIAHASDERVYPVGRLDRNTTGVLLLTNDGELTQRLSHPKFNIKKIYEVRLDKPVTKKDMETIAAGVTLEDGFIQPDGIAWADAKDKSLVGIQIHSGRNRIVRRIFEKLGYDVKNLDRVMFANLTKKNVDRGKWRYLNEKEIRLLKHFTPGK